MEEGFTLTWEGATQVVQNEDIICGMDESATSNTAEFNDVCEEVIVQDNNDLVDAIEAQEMPEEGNIMYLTHDNILVMQQTAEPAYPDQLIECQVAEEVITDEWSADCQEIVVGSEEQAAEEASIDDVDIPLPADQDQYTAARPYPCDFCSRRFRKKANLMNHMVAHQTDRPHGCNLCGVRYIRKCDLMNHLKIHAYIPETDGLEEEDLQTLDDSDSEKHYKRVKPRRKSKSKTKDDSGESLDDKNASGSRSYDYVDEDVRLMEAMENSGRSDYTDYIIQDPHASEPRYPITDPRKPFVCQHCGVGFAREKALASHARVHGGDSPFECQRCGEMFWDAALMREHVRLKHGGVEEAFDDDDDDEDYSEEETKYGQFFCPTCGLSFHRQENLKRHQRVHVKEEFESEFGHICNVCGESFQEALDLLAHAEIHARGTDNRCMVCGEACGDAQSVAAHVQEKHGKDMPANSCMLCGRTCRDRRHLLKHSWEHSKEKMFTCGKCGKNFHNKARLKRHMLSHRNKIVSCDVCGESFADGRSLMNHRHSHSSVSGRQFPCLECGKTFGSRSSQQIHIRIHTGERPYGCRFCWKAFADGGTLRKHERIHTGEKPYACAVCPRAFNQRVVLREHIRSHHSGPDPNYSHTTTPYCCSVCSDMFATSQDLIVHLIHHCDLNTAMKRQPQVGPRKYKRRRKLKPHELELLSNRLEDPEAEMEAETDSEEEKERRRKVIRKPKKASPKSNIDESYADVYNSFTSAIENINSIVNSKPASKAKKKIKTESQVVPSRPKMIHTQKARVPIDTGDGGKVRHRTKTLVTHTQPTELKSATGERIRPRTKNVNYHVLNPDKLPIATFPDDTTEAVQNLLASELNHSQSNGEVFDQAPDIASEQTVETEQPVPTSLIKVTTSDRVTRKRNNSLKPGRHIIGPGSKVVRLVKGGMIVSKNKRGKVEPEIEEIADVEIKQEVKQEEPSSLYELAELSMQHAQNMFKCEMCSEMFSNKEQLLEHVPVHI